jgi:ammonia channel protein AmtB
VLLWFLGGSLLAVWLVLHDPSFDYRLLWVGAVLPDVVDAPFGGARVMHSVTASVACLLIVIVATIGRRNLRKHLIALVFGMFLHLVLDGVFNNTKVFWWPLAGTRHGNSRLPSVARGAINIPLEIIGALILFWSWRRFRLGDRAARQQFIRTGRLDPGGRPNVPSC